ncbi:hypothetical protein BD560DRAFT_491010 [Blakeslea trispora]|nr:hypothetical protein BD560DRAFT_491010 [Blakeslea trispora]
MIVLIHLFFIFLFSLLSFLSLYNHEKKEKALARQIQEQGKVPPLGDSDDDFQAIAPARLKTKRQKVCHLLLMIQTSLPTAQNTYEITERLLHGSKKYVNDRAVDSKQAKQNSHTKLVYADKYVASQVCNKCQTRTLENIADINTLRKVYTNLKCKSYSAVWSHNVNVAKNIHHVFTDQANRNKERTSIFQIHPLLTR